MRFAGRSAALLAILIPSLAFAWEGKVVGISDGDTIKVMHGGRAEKVRLYGIDTPERHQDFGTRAQQFTSDKVFGKVVRVEAIDRDRYGRTVGVVHIGTTCVNEELVKEGLAWVYTKYCKRGFCAKWKSHQNAVRKARKGLWSRKNPIPPWDFRKGVLPAGSKVKNKVGGPFHGNVRSQVFHSPGCRHYNCKNCVEVFKTKQTATQAGYRPCGMCKP